MEQGPKKYPEKEWKDLQQDWSLALQKFTDEENALSKPAMEISHDGTMEEMQEFLTSKSDNLSEAQRNFLLTSLRVKKFKHDHNLK